MAGAALGLGHGEAQQVGIGQGLPQGAIDALVALFDGGHARRIDQAREQPGRRLGHGELLLAQGEVHQAPSRVAAPSAGTNTGNDSSSS